MEETPLREDWVAALLATPDSLEPDKLMELVGRMQARQSLKDRLDLIREMHLGVLDRIRVSLADNPLTTVVTQAAAKEAGLSARTVEVAITDLGEVVLRKRNPRPTTREGRKQSELERLRQLASERGLDVGPLGRSKAKIQALLESPVVVVAPPPPPKPEPPKPKPVPKKVAPPPPKPTPEGPGAEELLAGLFDPEPEVPSAAPPPKVVKALPLPKMAMLDADNDPPPKARMNLKALVSESETLDLDKFLAGVPTPPALPPDA